MTAVYEHDVLVIGSGAAGLSLALHLSADHRVALLSKAELTNTSSRTGLTISSMLPSIPKFSPSLCSMFTELGFLAN